MRKKPNIDIYACNISSVHIYNYNKLIQIYPYKTELDLSRVRLNSRLNNCLARLILFISVPFRPFRPFFPVFLPFKRSNRLIFVYPLNKILYHRLPFSGRLIGRLGRLGEHCLAVGIASQHDAS